MSLRQLNVLDILRRVERGEITAVKAASLLHLDERSVRRKVERLATEGPGSLQHGLKGRPSNNALPARNVKRVESLLRSTYPDFGPTLACEKLREFHGIDWDEKTIRGIQIRLGLWKPRTVRTVAAHRFFRERRAVFGELVQFDGCYHDWFEGRGEITQACLLLAIDDATGRVTHAWFDAHEGVLPVMGFWLRYASLCGLPKAVYLDRFSTYSMNMKLAKENPDTLTQFERAAKEAGVDVIHAYSSQAKGRVERVLKTWQDRLVKELRLRGVSSIQDANAFLQRTFIPDFNRRFGKEPRRAGDLHRKPAKDELMDILPFIFCRRETRVIQNDFTIPYKTRWFQLLPTPRLAMRPKETVHVHELPNGDIRLRVRGKHANFQDLHAKLAQTKRRADTLIPLSRNRTI